MNKHNFFQNHISKLRMEAIIKSALSGAAIGLLVNFVISLITWFTPFHGFWLSIGVFAAVSIVAGVLFYFKRFYPTDIRNARRIDSMGLYERLITMVEYENDDSYIASVQREDARRALASVEPKQIKIKLPKAVVVSLIVCFLLGASMSTVNAMSEQGIVPRGDELVGAIVGEATTVSYLVTYRAEDGGSIYGVEEQLLERGTNSSPVTAIANDGYRFVRWSDGHTNPTRVDENITADATYYAEFLPLSEEGAYEDDDEGDSPEDAPEKQNQGQGPGTGPSDQNPSDSLEGGGKYEANNQIINGAIYYREVIELYKDTADERILSEQSGLSEAEIEFIKKYLGIV